MPLRSRPNWIKRLISKCEPILQHQGVAYSFVFAFILLNVIVFFITAAPAWRANPDPDRSFIFRAAYTIARGGGAMLNLNSALVILVASRTLMTYLRQTVLNLYVPFDKAMPSFHTFVGNTLLVSAAFHVLGHIIRYIGLSRTTSGFFSHVSLAITGSLLTIILLSMRITSHHRVRQKSFETFSWVHQIGVVGYFIFIYMHGSHNGTLKTWMYVSIPLIIYLVDRSVRLKREHGGDVRVGRRAAYIKGADIVCLRIPRTFTYLAGQYCDIKIPLVSSLEWHPFTIASSPHESEMLFYIKVTGDWTKRLYQLFKERQNDVDDIQIHVRGPYGAPAQHVGQYEHVVLISGGVGATPMCAITKYAHHWILNYTQRGAAASNSVSAAFTRNQSVQGTPSIPGTPTRAPSSMRQSRNPSGPVSRNLSTNFSRNISRDMSRNFSRSGSRPGSRPLSRSGSGKLERFNSTRLAGGTLNTMSRSTSGTADRFNNSRPLSAQISRSTSGRMNRSESSNPMDRAGSSKTADSIAMIIQEQRQNQPYGPTGVGAHGLRGEPLSPGSPNRVGHGFNLGPEPLLASSVRSTDEYRMRAAQFLDDSRAFSEVDDDEDVEFPPVDEDNGFHNPDEVDNEFTRPDDYDEELGNPSLPIPDRRTQSGGIGDSPSISRNRQSTFELLQDMDSQVVFDEDEEHVEEEEEAVVVRGGLVNGVLDERFELDEVDLESGGLELEDQILREQNTASNAYNLLGMSFGPMAMKRHLDVMDAKRLRSSIVRTSANLMNEAMDAASWSDRVLFYMHTVTVNWMLLWVMLTRFTLVFIGLPTRQFKFSQEGLGVFESQALNVTDLVLAILVSLPIIIAIVMEIYVNDIHSFLSENIANSFDLFVLMPLLFACIVLHILNLLGIGKTIDHVSKLTVCCIWPVLGMFMLWRITRTIGPRVTLAPSYRSSHAQTKSLDYIWVSKTHEDDSWVIDELLPLADSNIVRLHRFITRHGPKTEPWMLDYEKVPLKTTYSRPDWDEVFGGLVERSKSGTFIGVFFCGPDSMAQMIQQSSLKAMAKSMDNAYARGYFTKKASGITSRNESGVVSDPNVSSMRGAGISLRSLDGAPQGSMRGIPASGPQSSQMMTGNDPAAYGCAVRIAIRVENFN